MLSKNERLIFDILKDGPRQYSEIINALKKHGVEKRTANNILKGLAKKEKVFRIEKGKNVFYRWNDFPPKIKLFFASIDMIPGDDLKKIFNEIKNDIIRLYPKLTFEQILDLWYLTIETMIEGNSLSLEVIQKFKNSLE